MGTALARSGRITDAREFLNFASASDELRTKALLALAEGQIATGDVASALHNMDAAPASFAVFELRAEALLLLNRRDEAEALLGADLPSAYIAATQPLLTDRKFEQALAILNTGLDRLPGNWLLLLRRGVTNKMQGAYQEARTDLTNALANGGDPALVAAALGDVLAAQGDLGGAAAVFESVLQHQNRPEFRLAYALALSRQGESASALREASRAVAERPSNARAHFEYGKLLRNNGEIHAARIEFERCRELDRRFGANLYALGRLYREAGDVKQAEAAEREFLMIKRSSAVESE